jgi:SynChlorMet cassette radical SAM/SPASM protein ScmF
MDIQADKKYSYPLHTIYFYPTESCNLKCIHCWIQPTHAVSKKAYNVQNKDNVSIETMEQVVQDAISLGLRHIKFTGGEPFLNPSIFECLDRLSCYELSFSFETNGTLLTRSMVQRLGHYNLKQISTSLDGSVPEVYDIIRRVKGSFKKALKGIELLIEHSIYPQVIFCLQKLNAHDLENTIRLAHRLGVKSFEINPLALNGDRPDSIGCESLPVEDLIELEKKVENELAEHYTDMHIDLYLPPALKGIQELSRHALCTCNIFNICGILSNGDVSICGIGRTNKDMLWAMSSRIVSPESGRRGSYFRKFAKGYRLNSAESVENVCLNTSAWVFAEPMFWVINKRWSIPTPFVKRYFKKGFFRKHVFCAKEKLKTYESIFSTPKGDLKYHQPMQSQLPLLRRVFHKKRPGRSHPR